MKALKVTMYLFIAFLFASCSNDIVVSPPESNTNETRFASTQNDFSTYSKIHYVISALGRIEDQLIENPNCKNINYDKFQHTIRMLDIIKQKEANFSTSQIMTICKNDKFINRFQNLDKDSSNYRKMTFYKFSVILLLADKKQTKALLDEFLRSYRSFVIYNKSKLKEEKKWNSKTRTSAGSYRITLKTPTKTYKIDCLGDDYILDAAEEAGIDLPYASRCGQDYSSAGKLELGTVDMEDNILTPEMIERGYILLDVARPTSDCIIVTNKEDELYENLLPTVNCDAPRLDGIKWPESPQGWKEETPENIPDGGGSAGSGTGSGSDPGAVEPPFTNAYKLTDLELEFIKWHPVVAAEFSSNADRAVLETDKFRLKYGFDVNSLHNGICDCYRHMLWSALNCFLEGEGLAREYGNAHESDLSNPEDERKMDLYNNNIGYGIGNWAIKHASGYESIPGLVEKAVMGGDGYYF